LIPGPPAERWARVEFGAEGRPLHGIALRYRQRARDRRETFEPGAFQPLGAISMNLQHDPLREIASTAEGTLRVIDGPDALRVEADLRPDSAELELVRRRTLRGLSVEFRARAEHRADGLRVVSRAELPGIALVDMGSYMTGVELRQFDDAAATLEIEHRARMGRTLSAAIPAGKRLACECSGPGQKFAQMMADGLQDAFDDAFDEASQVIATWASYSQPLGSVSRGTVRRTGPTEVSIDLPDDDYGRAALAAHESTGTVVRPYLDPADSQSVVEGEVRVYSRPVIRAFVVSSTDKREGWPTPTITATPTLEGRGHRRRRWL
ncbi:MAG: HK97 family phage prohead protease, partial [Acidimicrobiaceae bacterium]|nr:HK97 family phage prohead protease [Acidimicrobiaceae bacterium]